MPIYEYECPSCTNRFEEMMKMGAPAPACPKCGATETRKLVSAAAFMLKGSGWYKDHYGLKKDSGDSAKSSDSKPSTSVATPVTSGSSGSSGSDSGSSGSSSSGSGTPPATPASGSSSSGSSTSAS